jgi:hypothetical protein
MGTPFLSGLSRRRRNRRRIVVVVVFLSRRNHRIGRQLARFDTVELGCKWLKTNDLPWLA